MFETRQKESHFTTLRKLSLFSTHLNFHAKTHCHNHNASIAFIYVLVLLKQNRSSFNLTNFSLKTSHLKWNMILLIFSKNAKLIQKFMFLSISSKIQQGIQVVLHKKLGPDVNSSVNKSSAALLLLKVEFFNAHVMSAVCRTEAK